MSDPISPDHYQGFSNGAETIDIAENLTFNAGNALKYLARAGRIDGKNKGAVLEDLRKARWYIDREINRLEAQAVADVERFEGKPFVISGDVPAALAKFYNGDGKEASTCALIDNGSGWFTLSPLKKKETS